jgi:hypothetical protein
MVAAGGRPDNLEAYMNLGKEGVARLVLMLLVEERLRGRLAAFREKLSPEPVEGKEELPV